MTTSVTNNNAIKPLKSIYFIAVLLALAGLAWLLAAPETGRPQLDRIQRAGVLRVATRNGPTTFYEDAQGDTGLEYELAQRFAQVLGVRLELVVRDSYPQVLAALENGDADLAAAGLVETPAWGEHVRFGPAYQEITQKLVFRQGRALPRSLNQLDGQLRVQAHSSQACRLLELKKEYPELHWTESSDSTAEELLAQVLSGELDYTVVDSHELELFRRFNPDLAVAFTLSDAQALAWAFPAQTDDSLYAQAVDFFGQLNGKGELAQLVDRYYGHLQQFDYANTREFLSAVEATLPKFQDHFQGAAGADLDWRLLAAVSYQESLWDPEARSRTGVRGMMMLTENTAAAMGVTRRTDARQSIRGGAQYLRLLLDKVPTEIADPDRTWFALASYNVGWGHLEDARELTAAQGGDGNRWAQVKDRLPLLTQKKWYSKTRHGYARGYEPVRFVEAIRRYHETLAGLYKPDGTPAQVASALKAASSVAASPATAQLENKPLPAVITPPGAPAAPTVLASAN